MSSDQLQIQNVDWQILVGESCQVPHSRLGGLFRSVLGGGSLTDECWETRRRNERASIIARMITTLRCPIGVFLRVLLYAIFAFGFLFVVLNALFVGEVEIAAAQSAVVQDGGQQTRGGQANQPQTNQPQTNQSQSD